MNWSRLDSLTIRQLRVFCAVSRLLSYTRAAEELGCQQPTVSALVAELERATQLTLLEQWGKRLALTDEGHELYAHAQQVVAAADEAWLGMAELRGAAVAESMPLRVAADTTVGTYVLPHVLAAFHRSQPSIALNLRVANRADVRTCLLAGEVDLVIAGRPPAVDGLVVEPFLANPLVAIASPEHILVTQTHVPLVRLADEVFLLREVGSGTRAAVEELFEVMGMPLNIGMVLGHIEAIKQAVAAGLGVSVLSEVAVKREVQYGRLAILHVEHFPIQRRWYIARLAERPVIASTAEFIEFLRGYRLHRG
ncbi:MAG: LysR family transcriptional regulator, partial [Chloroflexota bacterium]|nr:LysR family transcriptional regulator [Chloroflexota bacterium]